MTQFYSRIDTTLNGDVYNIPFSYIKEAEIEVYLDDVLYEDWEFLNKSQIEIKNLSPELSKQTIVSIRRNTNISEKIVEYTNNTLLNKENLNLSQDQLLYAVQEIYDNNIQNNIDINNSVDEKVERVSEAVKQLEILDVAVDNAVTAANVATEQATIATEQANIATEQAVEATETYNLALQDITSTLETSLSEIQQTSVTEQTTLEGIKQEAINARDELVQGNMYKYNLFDPIEKDHILTYEESKGLALLGSYVYKEAVAGSRYGYADFYNKVVAEKEAGTATETTLGENTVTMYVNSNGHIFYDIADKGAVDVWYNTYGKAEFYGVDVENERIFLPYPSKDKLNRKLVKHVAGANGYDLYSDGWCKQWGRVSVSSRSNATITFAIPFADANYSAQATSITGTNQSASNSNNNSLGSLSTTGMKAQQAEGAYTYSWVAEGQTNNIVDLSDTKLHYMCVGNTEVSKAVTGITEVTTTENDTTPLFTGLYFDFAPNNVSWLKAGQQAKSGGIYEFVYNELVNELTTPKYGLKVIETKNMESGVDYSEYWKVNQDDMTFTTPTAISNKALSGAVVGNNKPIGLTNGTNTYALAGGLAGGTSNARHYLGFGAYAGTTVGGSVSVLTLSGDRALGLTETARDSGIIAQESTTAQLYFKVANAVQNLELLDAGEVLEAVNNVVPNNRELIASYGNPDYSAMITTSTAPVDGYFLIYTMVVQANTNVEFFINGVAVAGIDWVTSNTANRNGGWMFRCSKGDVFSYTKKSGTLSGITVNFVPLKGAN